MAANITEYKRQLAAATISTFQEHYQKQIDLIQRRSTNPTNVSSSPEFVRGHYLTGFERPADPLCALEELIRVLPYVCNSSEGLATHRLIIQCLASLEDQDGRDAWEDKMLKDFKFAPDACAEVYLNRGIRAYADNAIPV